jgi:hypothetical protein
VSNKNDYSAEEWQLLLDVPMMVGAAVMVIGKSGIGTIKESFTIAQQTLGAIKTYPDNELIQAVLASRIKDKEKSSIESFSNPMLKLPPGEFMDAVLEKCSAANKVLASQSNSAETGEYKDWIKEIADKVAHAASEGGILGFGGTQFSENEKLAINDIHAALNIG